ncbi:MAG: hypothetical protein LBI92_07360 [Azoarcus sp.]|jgi:WD40 repeat protein|nr:hypothetical protein [Azoarcus sp.]
MLRFAILLFCLPAIVLSSCLNAQPAGNLPMLTLIQDLEIPNFSASVVSFSGDGATFIVGSKYDGLGLFRANDFTLIERYYAPTSRNILDSKPTAVTHGMGYIDTNTWYFAAREWGGGNPVVAHIRTIQPSEDIATYSFEMHGEVLIANKNHIGLYEEMVNWHDGEHYHVKILHPNLSGYELTRSSRVLTTSYNIGGIFIDDPVNGKAEYLEDAVKISPNEHHAIILKWKQCKLLQFPENKEIGTCGRMPLFSNRDRHRFEFSPDGKLFVSWLDGKARVYQVEPFQLKSEFDMPGKAFSMALTISDSGWVAAIDLKKYDYENARLRAWDGLTGKLVGYYQTSAEALAIQPNGNKLIAVNNRRIMVFGLPERIAQ